MSCIEKLLWTSLTNDLRSTRVDIYKYQQEYITLCTSRRQYHLFFLSVRNGHSATTTNAAVLEENICRWQLPSTFYMPQGTGLIPEELQELAAALSVEIIKNFNTQAARHSNFPGSTSSEQYPLIKTLINKSST